MSHETPTRTDYVPRPIDTSAVSLPAALLPLLERLARNTHDVWAQQRMADGWTYGPARDDAAKRHPGLVPYDQLPESEKAYDRRTASETLRAILLMGYRIESPDLATEPAATAPDHGRARAEPAPLPFDAQAALAAITSRESGTRRLLDLWNAHREDDWVEHPELYARFAKRLIQLGEPLLALDALQVARVVRPDDRRLRHLEGLALARSGATHRAHVVAGQLVALLDDAPDSTARDLYEDIVGLLGRAAKELAFDTDDPDERRARLQQSFDAYERAFRATQRPYTGINAATTSLLLDDRARATAIANEVRAIVDHELAHGTLDDESRFWHLATLGEAALLLGDLQEARARYAEAQRLSGSIAPGDVASTRRQARLVLTHRGEPAEWIDEVLRIPAVVVFAGPPVDEADVPQQQVRDEIVRRLPADARVGFSSAADGADILFQEAMHERGAETHVVLPYGETEFLETSVSAEWAARFRRVRDAASECIVATQQRSVDEQLLVGYAQELLRGLAAIHARRIDARLSTLVLPNAQREPATTDIASGQSTSSARRRARIASVMFSDVVGFSKLTDAQVERFVRGFLTLVGDLARTSPHRPSYKNTWGDGLYFQFADVRTAGQFALELHEMVRRIDWPTLALPPLVLRTGLHAGPLFEFVDPVTGERCLWGRHVTRAARIEPVSPPGEVYASQEFAALAAAQGVDEFDCEPVGAVSLAKAYDPAARLYHVRRRGALRRQMQPER